jgi:hypothetical protein
MGFGFRIPLPHIPPIIQKINPVSAVVRIVEHPIQAIKNPITTISSLTPITAIAHEAIKTVPSLPIGKILEKAKEEAQSVSTGAFHTAQVISKEIIKAPIEAGKVVVKTGSVIVSPLEKAVVGVGGIAEDIVKGGVGMVKGVSHGVGGLFGDLKWIILGVVGIIGVVVVMKGKELMESGTEMMKSYKQK